jgi:hypothetical protein
MYKLWQVYHDKSIEFYVVNTVSRIVQSAWGDYFVAKTVCAKLNKERKYG